MSFAPFIYYSDGPRVEVSTDDAGNVYAAPALPGNGIFADVREPVRVGYIGREPSARSYIAAPVVPFDDGWEDEYPDERTAALQLVDWHHWQAGYLADD